MTAAAPATVRGTNVSARLPPLRANGRLPAQAATPTRRGIVTALVASVLLHASAFAAVGIYRVATAPPHVVVVPVEFLDGVTTAPATTGVPPAEPPAAAAPQSPQSPQAPQAPQSSAVPQRPETPPSAVTQPRTDAAPMTDAAAGPIPQQAAAPPRMEADGIAADASAAAAAQSTPPADPAAVNESAVPTQPTHVGPGLHNKPPRYPFSARRRGAAGLVVLRVRVTADGRASAVSVLRSSGHGVLDRAAADAVETWRFRPATMDGRPIAGTVDVPIEFKLTDR